MRFLLRRCWNLVGIFLAMGVMLAHAQASDPRAPDPRAVPPVVFGPDASRLSLAGHLLMLRDAGGRLTLEDVAFGPEGSQFQAAPPRISLGYTEDAYWFKVTVDARDPMPSQLYIWMRPNFLDYIDVYYPGIAYPRSAADFKGIPLGDHTDPVSNSGHAPFQFVAFQPPGAAKFDIYIRVQTSSSLIFEGWLGTSVAYAKTAAQSTFVLGFASAFFLTLAAIIFLAWTRSKNPIMLWFALFVFAFSTNIVPMSGFGLTALRALDPKAPDQFCQFAFLATHFFGLGYMSRQTDLKSCCPHLELASNLAMVYIALGFCLSLLGLYNIYIRSELVIVSLLLMAFAYKNMQFGRHAQRGARLAAAGCVTYACAAIPYHAALLGLFAPTGDLMGLIAIGNLLFVALLAIALLQQASHMEYLRREHELLAVSRQAEREATQLVAARTAQLISAKEAAERALEQERAVQAEQLRFVDVVTHQYRTPLAIIRSCVTAIRYALAPLDGDNRRRIGQIDAAVQRLVEIMDISLHRTRVEGYAGKANRRSVSIIPAITKLLDRSRELHPDREIVHAFHGIEPADEVAIDLDMVAIALGNLIDNAAKFSPETTPISVAISSNEAGLSINVEDEGIGIPENEIAKVGQRYFRASNSGRIFGTGLGLNIVQQVATAHSGHFRVANREAKGTLAVLTLPLESA